MTNFQRATRYPHLTAEDSLLWSDFLESHHPPHLSFLYDVSVGEGRDPGSAYPANIRSMATQLSKRRIDVVGILPDRVDVFELTQSAGLRATGQAIAYPLLLTVCWSLSIPVASTIICRSCQDNIAEVLQSQNIGLVIVSPLSHA